MSIVNPLLLQLHTFDRRNKYIWYVIWYMIYKHLLIIKGKLMEEDVIEPSAFMKFWAIHEMCKKLEWWS